MPIPRYGVRSVPRRHKSPGATAPGLAARRAWSMTGQPVAGSPGPHGAPSGVSSVDPCIGPAAGRLAALAQVRAIGVALFARRNGRYHEARFRLATA
jgi:hypothetical protein